MKPAAVGRILFWRGASLWIGHAGEPSDFHSHHAVQIALPFRGGTASFRRPSGDWQAYPAAIIAADAEHAFEARGQFMAQIFVEPESMHGRALRRRFGDQPISSLPVDELRSAVEALARGYERRATDAELITLAQAAVATIAGIAPVADPIDPRIVRAIEFIRGALDESLSVARIAAKVNLSPERFRHLFVSETGVGFRPYVLWLRMEHALSAYVKGSALTEAAIASGFSDAPHFSRTFRKMFGIAPASVRPD